MKQSRMTAGSLAELLNPLAGLSPLVGLAASLAGALPARGGEVPFTERVISTTADFAVSVFATDVDGDGDTDVLSASFLDDKIAWYESDGGSPPTSPERANPGVPRFTIQSTNGQLIEADICVRHRLPAGEHHRPREAHQSVSPVRGPRSVPEAQNRLGGVQKAKRAGVGKVVVGCDDSG